MIIAALGWFLLKELASVLRPLLMAVILAYVLMPYHSRLRNRVTAPVSLVLLASFTVGSLIALASSLLAPRKVTKRANPRANPATSSL